MICPRCSVAEIHPTSGACTLCGYVPEGNVAVEAPHPDATDHRARQELAHEFRIDVLLGQGEHSAVYLVREGRSSKYMVLKVLPRPQDRDPQSDERFRRAAELVASLDHPHIVPVHRFGVTDSLFWYTMEHVRARSLREILRSRGPLELKVVQRIVTQAASALDYAHRRGVVHGGLKPENILIDPNGWVHLCDPLIRHAIERPEKSSGRASGMAPRPSGTMPRTSGPVSRPSGAAMSPPPSPAPAAESATAPGEPAPRTTPSAARRLTPSGDVVPESASRRPDYAAPEDRPGFARHPASDQYALAVLVHECLAGSPPSAGVGAFEPPAQLATVRPDLPPHVTHAVRRAMSPKPGDRYPAVLDFVMALESGVLPLTDARPTGRASEVILTVPDWQPPPSTRPAWLTPVLAVATIAVAAVVAWFPLQHWRQARAERQRASLAQFRIPQPPVQDTGLSSTPATQRADSLMRAHSDSASQAPLMPYVPGRGSRRSRGDSSRQSSTSRPAAPAPSQATTPSPAPSRGAAPAPSAPAPVPAATVAPAAEATGRLSVNASPWGQVFIDGNAVGNTPKANLPVAPGTHTVRVVRDGYAPFERTVQVGANETVRLTDIVLTPRP